MQLPLRTLGAWEGAIGTHGEGIQARHTNRFCCISISLFVKACESGRMEP
jgi:hypothetical protein